MDFPVADFRKLLEIGQGYPTDTRVKPVLGGSKPEPGLSAEDLLRIKLNPTAVAVARAFDPQARHHLYRPHWLIWMGCEVGMKRVETSRGAQFVYFDPVNLFPMNDIEAATYYNYTIRTTQRYLRQARAAVLDEYYAVAFFGGNRLQEE